MVLGCRTIPTRVGRTRCTVMHRRAESDHPHAGGENTLDQLFPWWDRGPSPRGWGELSASCIVYMFNRTIPTRVGRTRWTSCSPGGIADHPHAGGENRLAKIGVDRNRGPSPRGWGERTGIQGAQILGRTIPTRVGRTLSAGVRVCRGADHPHAGGENPLTRRQHWHPHGPSPRGWGELNKCFRALKEQRTIPTRVGRTCQP